MNPILRNIIAVILGVFIGGICNMLTIQFMPYIVPYPEGIISTDTNSIIENIHRFEFKHFLTPFIAHSLQPLVGAFIAVKIGISHHFRLAMIVGCISLLGGIMAVKMIPAPMWYCIIDLVFAYIPMAWLGYKLANRY